MILDLCDMRYVWSLECARSGVSVRAPAHAHARLQMPRCLGASRRVACRPAAAPGRHSAKCKLGALLLLGRSPYTDGASVTGPRLKRTLSAHVG